MKKKFNAHCIGNPVATVYKSEDPIALHETL